MKLHVACLNVILNILPSCGHICISGFRCRLSVISKFIYKCFIGTLGVIIRRNLNKCPTHINAVAMLGAICGSAISMDLPAQSMDP